MADFFLKYLTMGCVCARETVTLNQRRYYVRSRLGEGGFSYVDLVEDGSGKPYALKRIMCHSKDDQETAKLEIKYMQTLNHPNLIQLVDSGIKPVQDRTRSILSEVLICMPFFKRGTLHNELEVLSANKSYMTEGRMMKIFQSICHGLKALHDHQPQALAHRDMKPHNVLMDFDDTPVLMDFGSMGSARVMITSMSEARALQDLAAERCSMPYRAPELFNVELDSTIDERIDIWSLGCTLYAMCFHESPFDQAYMRGDSIALAVLGAVKIPENHPFSSGVTDLIKIMLQIDPQQRPFIDEIIAKTENFVSHHEIANRI